MSLPNGTKGYIQEVNLVRALAILGVLTVHATALTVVTLHPKSTLYGMYDLLNIAFKYGTPTFIFLSSFVLFHGYFNRPFDVKVMKHFFKRRLLFILLPYFFFSLAYTIVKSYVYYGFGDWREWTVDFLYRLATGNAHAHLYFIIISIQFYALFPFLLRWFQTSPWIVKHAFWVGFALQWAFVLLNRYELHLSSKGSLAFSYLSVYLLGAYVGVHYESLKRSWIGMRRIWPVSILSIAWIVALLGHFSLIHIYRVYGVSVHSLWYELAWNAHTAATAILLFYGIHRISGSLPAAITFVLERLGQASFGIYLIHPFLLIAFETYIRWATPHLYHLSIGLKWIFVLASSYVAVRVGRLLLRKASPFVLGESSNSR